MVDWNRDVLPHFPQLGELTDPWRWRQNKPLGLWLRSARTQLRQADQVDLAAAPSCVTRIQPASQSPIDRGKAQSKACRHPKAKSPETVIIIGDKASEKLRASLASRVYATAIEPLECRRLKDLSVDLKELVGVSRLKAVLQFAADVMVGNRPICPAETHREVGDRLATSIGDKAGRECRVGNSGVFPFGARLSIAGATS